MTTEYRLISNDDLDFLRGMLKRSITYCTNATSTDFDDPEQEPTATYPGASGYARQTMIAIQDVLDNLTPAQ